MMAAARRSCQRNCWMLAFGGSETLVRKPWTRHNRSMNRTRISTTVDTELLYAARSVAVGKTDASLIDEALSVLLDRYGSVAEIDASYAAYDRQPLDEPDRSEEHTSELQSRGHLVCRLLLEKKKER